jgi:crotonobetainyl-CoA:carnitine CoA-transferase CaiB-like acyl-CoA transferase
MTQPLTGVRVLDLSRVLAGPWCTQILGDLGAEVIKIERPGDGDDTRAWGPPFVQTSSDPAARPMSAYFISANRGKRSVTIDFSTPEGAALVQDMAKTADVVVENFKVGSLKRAGLDYASLSAINPRLVYCSVTGFGQTGPHQHRAGYDLLAQAMGGLMSLTGEPDRAPMKSGPAVADIQTGLYATIGILAALRERDQSGKGQHIDVCLLDTQIATLAHLATNCLASGASPKRWGNAHPTIVPYQSFATADGHIVVAVGNDGQFTRFAAIIGRPDIAHDRRFAKNSGRIENRTELIAIIAEALVQKPANLWLAALEDAGIPAAPINTVAQALADPQVAARHLVTRYDGADGGRPIDTVANPIQLSRTPIPIGTPPPDLGTSTDDVLKRVLGLDEERLMELRRRGVI